MKVTRETDPPRGGWSVSVPDTGQVIRSGTLSGLVRKVRTHLENNGLPVPPDFRPWLEDRLCSELDPATRAHACADIPEPVARTKGRGWTADDVRRFLSTVLSWGLKSRFAFVEQAEAERRAEICSRCPSNVPVKGCLGCKGVGALVAKLKGSRSTTFDPKLETCDVCGCYLTVKVWLPEEAVDNTGLAWPSECWNHVAEDDDRGVDQDHDGDDRESEQQVDQGVEHAVLKI